MLLGDPSKFVSLQLVPLGICPKATIKTTINTSYGVFALDFGNTPTVEESFWLSFQ